MKTRKISNILTIYFGLFFGTFMINHNAMAIQDDQADPKNAKQEQTERISVVGQRPLGLLRETMVEARYDFFDMFNALNEKPEFEIHCRKESKIGRRVKMKVCEAQYVIDMRAEVNGQKRRLSNLAGGTVTQVDDRELHTYLDELHKAADDEKIRLISKNPKLMEQFMKLVKSEKQYKEKHAQVHGSMSNFSEDEQLAQTN